MPTRNRLSVRRVIFLTLIVVGTGVHLEGQERRSLKDAARANGGKTTKIVMVNMPFVPLSRVIEQADVILHGQVAKTEVRLSSDEESVLTYVTLTPIRYLKGSGSATTSAPKPGIVPAIVFVESGGTIKVDGLEITERDRTATDPPLQVGDDVIVFLTKGNEPGVFQLQFGAYGLLRVRGDKVEAGSTYIAKVRPLDSYGLGDVQRTIRELVAASKR